MHEFYARIAGLKKTEISSLDKCKKYSNARLICAFVAIGGAALIFNKIIGIGILLIFAGLGGLIVFGELHSRAVNLLIRTRCMIRINESYIRRTNGEWINNLANPDDNNDADGIEFLDNSHPYASDLDLFGDGSLFQFMSCAGTFFGRASLAELLRNPDKTVTAIHHRQAAVQELSKKMDFCISMQTEAQLSKYSAESPHAFLEYLEANKTLFSNSAIRWLFIALPIMTITCSIGLFWSLPFILPLSLSLSLSLIQGALRLYFAPSINNILSGISKIQGNTDVYHNLIATIMNEDFESELLKKVKSRLMTNGVSPLTSLKYLDRIGVAADIKYNDLLSLIFNIFLCWDFNVVFMLEKWKSLYGKNLRSWLMSIGELEGYISLAACSKVEINTCFPHISDAPAAFFAKKILHPLISKDAVSNDFEINSGAAIITGSNMSGKTTFLRTVGINLVLAYAGAPVFATELKCSVMDIFTSMRIADNLSEGISTFYAELLRIKSIVDYSKTHRPMLFLLDEIFRGTNSNDRISGALTVINVLNQPWISGLISTHDFELCELASDSQNIKNYHFTEFYESDKIMFDYLLRDGRCTTTNAKYLMRLVGIIT